MQNVIRAGNDLALSMPYDPILVERIKGMPEKKWNKAYKLWVFKPTLANIEYLNKWFPDAKISGDAQEAIEEAQVRRDEREQTLVAKTADDWDFSKFDGMPFRWPPYLHQKKALALGCDHDIFAYLMDQGTGKTKVLLDDAAYNYRNGKINALLVVCPNSVKTNWVDPKGGFDEVTNHAAPDIPVNRGCWVSNPTAEQKAIYKKFRAQWGTPGMLHVFAVNVDVLFVDRAYRELETFCKMHRVMIAADESTRIKSRTAKRTKAALKLRKLCPMARIMSGTPIIKSPLDAFAQFKFLDDDILGYTSYYAFQNTYAVMGGYGGYQVLYYKNLEVLQKGIDSCSYRVMKEECLDLPPKSYQRRNIEMTTLQAGAYAQMRESMVVNLENYTQEHGRLEADVILTQLLRLQQITAGFLPIVDDEGLQVDIAPIGDKNPKIEETLDIIEQCNHKVIVWCRFRAEIQMLCRKLEENGIVHVSFYGDTTEQDRVDARRRFQDAADPTKVFVGQVRTGGIGITLHAARTVIYLSNSFSTEDRVQSEDRAHRIGQEHPVEYIDLVCPKTVDDHIIKTLRQNKKISDAILSDGFKEWI